MTKFKKNSNNNPSIKAQDKTDWKKIYNQSQASADRDAAQDKENPILKKSQFKRLSDKT